MKKLAQEFKDFIMRGNVLDMAVGVIIATAFGAITNTLINNILMPLIGFLIGDIDLAQWDVTLRPAVMEGEEVVKEAVVIGFGTFITAIINFLLVALVVFAIVKSFNKAREVAEAKLKKQQEEEAAEEEAEAGPSTEELLQQILDELKKKK